MNKLITFFLFMLFGCGLLIGIMAGGGGVVTADLTADVTANQTYIPVTTTQDFYVPDYIFIGQEKVYYNAKNATAFLSCVRGYGNTTATAHRAGTRVYSPVASAINNAMGFNIVAVQDQHGWAALLTIPFLFLTRTIPHIMRMSTNLLHGELAIISWLFYIMAAGFLITFIWSLVSARRVA